MGVGFWVSKRLGLCSVLHSELWGLLEGLLSAWSLNIPCLLVEIDSLEAYHIISEPKAACGGSTLVPYILVLISRPWEVRLHHFRRSGNVLADRTAKLAPVLDFIIHRYLDPPSDHLDIIAEEAVGEVSTI
ncbi:hypothetical protein V6N11_029612 [Hibiscus sabdariffa]|uniref:RNase H type-1 domain-containing protein n=1 Tax=Hibiscus sabdariffa TaxID=183260 RepID=A0ABR2P797_9ROSI